MVEEGCYHPHGNRLLVTDQMTCQFTSVYSAFEASAEEHADRLFLHAPHSATKAYANGPVSYSYSETMTAVQALVRAYADREIQRGDRIAVAFDSRLDVYLHLLALNYFGASIVPLNSAASDSELHYVIGHSDSRLLVAATEYVGRLQRICNSIDQCAVTGPLAARKIECVGKSCVGNLATEAALLYTSGTTGKPKGCMLSNDYFLSLGSWYNGLGGICSLDKTDRMMTPLPPNHMNALATSFTAMMMCGGCLIQLDRFHPREWWQTARDEGATVIHCLGVMVAILLTFEETSSDDFSDQIKFCFGPGSDPRHQKLFEDRFGFPLVEAWAMTETGAGGMTIADKAPRHVGERCIGRAPDSMAFRIVDEEDNDVAPGTSGELLVRWRGDDPRKHFFSGYHKDEAATAEGWKGGWWHTGDVVRQGPDGSFFFVDRRKNVIRRSGENIAAVEVEAVLLQHDLVSNCAVCPVADEIRGDEVFAFIVLRDGASANGSIAPRIFAHCMEQLVYFKVPAYIAVVDALPLTASQKVSRGDVKKLAATAVASGNCVDLRAQKKGSKAR